MLIEQFEKKNIRLTDRGKNWCDNIEAVGILLVILLAFGVVGSIETGRWFG